MVVCSMLARTTHSFGTEASEECCDPPSPEAPKSLSCSAWTHAPIPFRLPCQRRFAACAIEALYAVLMQQYPTIAVSWPPSCCIRLPCSHLRETAITVAAGLSLCSWAVDNRGSGHWRAVARALGRTASLRKFSASNPAVNAKSKSSVASIVRTVVHSWTSALMVLAGICVTGVAWATCCIDSGQCTHNPHNSCGQALNDYYDLCASGECCHIRVYQCESGDTCRARLAGTTPLCNGRGSPRASHGSQGSRSYGRRPARSWSAGWAGLSGYAGH